jgi:hypothetical protein
MPDPPIAFDGGFGNKVDGAQGNKQQPQIILTDSDLKRQNEIDSLVQEIYKKIKLGNTHFNK